MVSKLVAALLVSPVLPGGPQQEHDPHDDAADGEHRGEDKDAGHVPSIPPPVGSKPGRARMFGISAGRVRARRVRRSADADVIPGVDGMEAG